MIFKMGDITEGSISCELVKRISGGSMAELYLARIQNTEYQAVIKAVSSKADIGRRQALRREAYLLERLYHTHIPQFLSYVEEAGKQYYVMSFHEGITLEWYAASGRQMSEEQILKLLRDMGSALQYLHQKGIFHGDVKPSNILLDDTGDAVLLDFGTADYFDTAQNVRFRGTLGYAAPECWHGDTKRLTPAADLFSLGATLYFLLEGRQPRDDYGHFKLRDAQKKNRWQPVLDRCCTLNKEKRFQSAAELIHYTTFAM